MLDETVMLDETERVHAAAERALEVALRGLPLRRAPASLELRVHRELCRRASLPWWRLSFAFWRLPARCGFVALSAVLIWLMISANLKGFPPLESLQHGAGVLFIRAQAPGAVVASISHLTRQLAEAIPPGVFYASFAIAGLLYVLLFGLGATLYRTVYVQTARHGR